MPTLGLKMSGRGANAHFHVVADGNRFSKNVLKNSEYLNTGCYALKLLYKTKKSRFNIFFLEEISRNELIMSNISWKLLQPAQHPGHYRMFQNAFVNNSIIMN